MNLFFKNTFITLSLLFSCYAFSQNEKLDSIQKSLIDYMEKKEKVFSLKDKKLLDFNLETLNGKQLSSHTLQEKPTIINFWFDACQPCIDELPLFNKLQKKYKNKANFIAITFLNKEETSSFLKNNTFNFTHLINSNEYIKKIGIIGYPITLVLDKNLVVKSIYKKFSKEELTTKEKTELEKQLITLFNE